VATLLLAAVPGPGGQGSIAFAADHLVDVVVVHEGAEVWLDPPAAAEEAKLQVKRGLLLDAVVGHGAPVLQLRPRQDEPLLVRGDTFLVLDLSLDGGDGVAALDLEDGGLPR